MRARVKLCLGEAARSVYGSLAAEVAQGGPAKGDVEVLIEGKCVIVAVSAESISGLRALVNSYLLLAHAAYSAVVESKPANV